MELAARFRHSASMVAVLRVDDGTFEDVNSRFEQEMGWTRAEIIGRRPLDLDLWPHAEIRARIWGALRGAGYISAEQVEMRRRDGRVLWGTLSAEIFAGDDHARVLCMMQGLREGQAPALIADDLESYRALFLAAAEGLYRSLPGGGFIDVNPAMARAFGFDSPAQMILETRVAKALYAYPAHAEVLHVELTRHGRVSGWRSLARRRDGRTIWIDESSREVRDADGRLLFYEGSVTDCTARVEAETALRESEELYRTLIGSISDGVFLLQQGRLVFANDALAEITGFSIEEMLGRDYMELVGPAFQADQLQRRDRREAGSREIFAHELGIRRRDGSERTITVRSAAVDYRGAIASIGVVHDVTDERRQQSALAEAERRYRELFVHSPLGLYRTDLQGQVHEANPALATMMGYRDPDDLKRSIRNMMEVYPDPSGRAAIIEPLQREGSFRDVQARVKRRDGSIAWVEISARVIHGTQGEVAFEGSVQDITERRSTQQALQRSEARYRTLVEHAQVGVFVSREDRYVYVNRAMATLLGYTEEELLRIPHTQLTAPEYVEAAVERYRRRQAGLPAATEYESCMVHKDGSRVYVSVSIGPLDIDDVPHMTGTVLDITRRRHAEQRLKFQAEHDPLTGLPNRLKFQLRLDEAMKAARFEGARHYAVLFLDLDGFKLVNDSLGHAVGDRLLVAIAEKLSVAMAGEAMVARYGGDEFTILPHRTCDRERALALAERVLGLFDRAFEVGGHQVFSGCSVGIVLGRNDYRSPDQVLRDADTAMYRAKAQGKSGYVVFDEAMHAAARARFQTEIDLRHALERNEFRVHYQPIVALQDGRPIAVEALVRWEHPQRGLLRPAEFLQVAEEAGLIAELDWWVVEQACRQIATWRREFGPAHAALALNVNVDERQLAQRDMVADLSAVLEGAGLPSSALSLEVTESIFRSGQVALAATLRELKQLGVGLVVDDFGTGWSSLDSFAASPFDALKVDRTFVQDMESNRRHRAIVNTIIRFAEDLGLSITAEGVETEGQAQALRDLGCGSAQGYLFAPPLPPDEFARRLLGASSTRRAANA